MSVRSSARNVLVVALATLTFGACGKKGPKLPEADPAKLATLAATMLKNAPLPAGARECKYEEMLGNATMTRKTLLELAKQPLENRPELSDWVNPGELDSPAARQLVESTDPTRQRQAAAELLLAPSFLIYNVDLVDAPIPLGVKDFKRGHVGARALRYDKAGNLICASVFLWTNDPQKQLWAIEKSDKPMIDPEVQKAMQKDLREQMLLRVAGLGAPAPKFTGPADDRHDRN
ncbi:MAG: hypothetical protein H0V17_26705 [Deltaproteobacteria bacterium]|nr:hypothetical protein [Deltaproteobacteria bacterium]